MGVEEATLPDRFESSMFGATFRVLAGTSDVTVHRAADGALLDRFDSPSAARNLGDLEAAAAAWVARRIGAELPAPTPCTACGGELTPVLSPDAGQLQFSDALVVNFDGGYGMFVDPVDRRVPTAVLCGACAEQLVERLPWAAELLADV